MYMFVICYSESTGNIVNDVQFEYLVTIFYAYKRINKNTESTALKKHEILIHFL